MNKTKLITLTPSDSFFFGGEQTFGKGENRNFYAASRHFPQQTSIVGLIRHALFEADKKQHFGNSFVVGKGNNFGWLKSISPVFIHHKDKIGIPIRLPIDKEGATLAVESKPIPSTQVDLGNGFQDALILEHYKEKYGTDNRILWTDGELVKYDTIFRKDIKTGIARDRIKHITTEGMFYRQLLYRMQPGYSFAVYVTADDERLFHILDGRNMPFGGEKVNFVIKVHEEGDFNSQVPTTHLRKQIKGNNWIFLTADAYVDESILKHCHLAMADNISFRNIVTPKDYSAGLDKEKQDTSQRRYKSEKMTLLKRGSILFPKGDKNQTIVDMLQNKQFQEIGYNYSFNAKNT